MTCSYCELFKNGEIFSETDYYRYIKKDNKLFVIWYLHESLMNLSKCKRMAHDMQLRLQAEAKKFFGTNKLKVTGDIDTHVHFVAEAI